MEVGRIAGDLQCLVEPTVEADNGIASHGGPAGIVREIAADSAGSLDRLDDHLAVLADDGGVLLIDQVFRQAQDQLQRVFDVMGDPGGERADAGQFIHMNQLGLQAGVVLDQFAEQTGHRAIYDLRPRSLVANDTGRSAKTGSGIQQIRNGNESRKRGCGRILSTRGDTTVITLASIRSLKPFRIRNG